MEDTDTDVREGNSVPRSRDITFTSYVGPLEWKSTMKYLVQAPEVCPTTGREHWQGYVYYKNAQKIKSWCKTHNIRGRKSEGSAEENRTYIVGPYDKNGKYKPYNPDHIEMGEMPKQGKRNDLKKLGDLVREGYTDKEICKSEMCNSWLHAYRGVREMRLVLKCKKRTWPMQVYIRWGKAGSGKTRWVYDMWDVDDIYSKDLTKWWDGYEGQRVVLIDDFRPFTGEIDYQYLLRLTDRYPMRVEYKGGSCEFCSRIIVITSNIDPKKWWDEETWEPMGRRVNEIVNVV